MMLLDYFGVFIGFLEKGTKLAKFGNFWGPMPRRSDPT